MRQELAEIIVEACKIQGIEADIHEDYSGRGMFGDTTTGVVSGGVAKVLSAVISNADMLVDHTYGDPEPLFSDLDIQTDSMGLGIIIY